MGEAYVSKFIEANTVKPKNRPENTEDLEVDLTPYYSSRETLAKGMENLFESIRRTGNYDLNFDFDKDKTKDAITNAGKNARRKVEELMGKFDIDFNSEELIVPHENIGSKFEQALKDKNHEYYVKNNATVIQPAVDEVSKIVLTTIEDGISQWDGSSDLFTHRVSINLKPYSVAIKILGDRGELCRRVYIALKDVGVEVSWFTRTNDVVEFTYKQTFKN